MAGREDATWPPSPDAGRTEANARAAEASAPPDAEPLLREALAKIEAAGAARLDAVADDGIVRLLERIEDEARRALAAGSRTPSVPEDRTDEDGYLHGLASTLGEWDSPEDEADWCDL